MSAVATSAAVTSQAAGSQGAMLAGGAGRAGGAPGGGGGVGGVGGPGREPLSAAVFDSLPVYVARLVVPREGVQRHAAEGHLLVLAAADRAQAGDTRSGGGGGGAGGQ